MRLALPLALILAATPLAAQNPPAAAPATPASPPLDVGVMAPDFVLRGATRYGTLREPVRLSDYRGKTVVLAFFARARTRG